jgi:hypothetical protein
MLGHRLEQKILATRPVRGRVEDLLLDLHMEGQDVRQVVPELLALALARAGQPGEQRIRLRVLAPEQFDRIHGLENRTLAPADEASDRERTAGSFLPHWNPFVPPMHS